MQPNIIFYHLYPCPVLVSWNLRHPLLTIESSFLGKALISPLNLDVVAPVSQTCTIVVIPHIRFELGLFVSVSLICWL